VRRIHLFEIEDQSWCPKPVRDGVTAQLAFIAHASDGFAAIVPRLSRALERAGATQILDLASGAGGPWLRTVEALRAAGLRVEVQLSDLHPNSPALDHIERVSGGQIQHQEAAVDASRVPTDLLGFRTLFNGSHHLRPNQAIGVLRDAVAQGRGIAIFDGTDNRALGILAVLLAPLGVLFAAPFIRPLRLSQLFFTYLVPLIPFVVLFDGIVSVLRTYSPAELRALVASLPTNEYEWEAGAERIGAGPLTITYLIGIPPNPATVAGSPKVISEGVSTSIARQPPANKAMKPDVE
jgi:hypothetical protein